MTTNEGGRAWVRWGCRRKDCLETDEEAKAHPTRNYFFRPNADVDKLIDVCTRKLTTDATNTRALLIRASSYVKRGARPPRLPPALPRLCAPRICQPCPHRMGGCRVSAMCSAWLLQTDVVVSNPMWLPWVLG
jgi:hypothetical protein